MHPIDTGRNTNTPAHRNGKNAPSLHILIIRSGIHPTGDVLRIMNPKVSRAVKHTVLIVNLLPYFR